MTFREMSNRALSNGMITLRIAFVTAGWREDGDRLLHARLAPTTNGSSSRPTTTSNRRPLPISAFSSMFS